MQTKQEPPTVAATAEVKFYQAHLFEQLESNNSPKHKKLKAINKKYNDLCELICNLIQEPPTVAETAVLYFNQKPLCNKLENNNPKYKKLKAINTKYNGLCELICNLIIDQDLLQKDTKGTLTQPTPDHLSPLAPFINQGPSNTYTENITLDALLNSKIANSHLLEVSSFFSLLSAISFGIYPYNIFSWYQQNFSLITRDEAGKYTLNTEIIEQKLNQLKTNTYIKVEVFNGIFNGAGHSLLIKKIDNETYIFFDPNEGSVQLNKQKLRIKLNSYNDSYSYITFLNGNTFAKDNIKSATNTYFYEAILAAITIILVSDIVGTLSVETFICNLFNISVSSYAFTIGVAIISALAILITFSCLKKLLSPLQLKEPSDDPENTTQLTAQACNTSLPSQAQSQCHPTLNSSLQRPRTSCFA